MTTTTTTTPAYIVPCAKLALLCELAREDLLGDSWAEAMKRCDGDRDALRLHAQGIVNDVLRIAEDRRYPQEWVRELVGQARLFLNTPHDVLERSLLASCLYGAMHALRPAR